MSKDPATLGEKLIAKAEKPRVSYSKSIVLLLLLGGVFWWIFNSILLGAISMVMGAIYLLIFPSVKTYKSHFLLDNDRQHFMKDLKLLDKTAVFDGSNIYHFGLDNGVGPKALKALVQELRSEGYRIVCFFDANIYYRLLENNEFHKGFQRFSIRILQRIFGLGPSEIYVVPGRTRADPFVIDTLSHLPISFAVTNDRFRDYEAKYDFLTKDKSWRKGVVIKNGNLSLYQHSFKKPVII